MDCPLEKDLSDFLRENVTLTYQNESQIKNRIKKMISKNPLFSLHLEVQNYFLKYKKVMKSKDTNNYHIRLKMFMNYKSLYKGTSFGELALINS